MTNARSTSAATASWPEEPWASTARLPDWCSLRSGPKMLELAGRLTDGTVTWMTGAETIRRHVVPTIAAAAASARRPPPRVVVGLPVCVTDDTEGARERVGSAMAAPASLPSYKRMLAAEGVSQPVDIALVGSEDQVTDQISALGRAGATELLANVQGDREEQDRTRMFLGQLGPGLIPADYQSWST